MKILLLEDDRILAETIQEALSNDGYDCEFAFTGESALELSYRTKFDLYLLDINVPGIIGTVLLKELRTSGDTTPAVFITSKSDELSIIEGYEIGCDDYLRKPFSLVELTARLRAIFRRAYGFNEQSVAIGDDVTFNLSSFMVTAGENSEYLPKKRGKILSYLLKNQGRIIEKDELIAAIWNDAFPSDAVIRVHMSSIKKLIGSEFITTINGVGYRFEKL